VAIVRAIPRPRADTCESALINKAKQKKKTKKNED
jgi:hypothetical protein